MAEAVAADRARVGLDRQRLDGVLVGLGVRFELELVVVLVVLFGGSSACAVAVAVLALLLGGGDQLGEHPGERVHLVAAQLGARGEVRRLLREHALEPEHERVADLPLGRRRLTARVQLGERVVERAAPRGPGRQRDVRVLVGTQEGLAGPGFGSKGVGPNGQRVHRFARRMRDGFCQCVRHVCRAASSKGCAPRVQAPFA